MITTGFARVAVAATGAEADGVASDWGLTATTGTAVLAWAGGVTTALTGTDGFGLISALPKFF